MKRKSTLTRETLRLLGLPNGELRRTGGTLTVALLGALLSFPSAAQPRLHDTPKPPIPVSTTAASSLLYALPPETFDSRQHRLDFVLTAGQAVLLKESLVFTSVTDSVAGRQVVEVFPLHPQLLSYLR